jgi:hypothetical protein
MWFSGLSYSERAIFMARIFLAVMPMIENFKLWLRRTDAVHFILGVLTRVFRPYSLIILVVYSVYQVAEKEPVIHTLKDFVVYILGYISGDVLWK